MRAASKRILRVLKQSFRDNELFAFLEDVRRLNEGDIEKILSSDRKQKKPSNKARATQLPSEATPESRVIHILLKDCKLSKAVARDLLKAELRLLTGKQFDQNTNVRLEDWVASMFRQIEPSTIMRAAMAIKYRH